MFCPNCGKKITDGKKFCQSCGEKIDYDEQVQNETLQLENAKPTENSLNILYDSMPTSTKKIIATVIIILLIILTAVGIMQYKQYQKDIEPYQTTISFFEGNDVILNATYNNRQREAKLSMLHKGTIIEQWQINYLNNDNYSYELTDTSKHNYTFDFINAEVNLNKPLVLNFRVCDVKTLKDFVKFKENLSSINLNRGMQKILLEDKKSREEAKNKWLKWKKEQQAKEEAERKQREWQENILSNCVYKTSDGVCFTTQVHDAEYIYDGKDYAECNFWLAAKDFCESKGYKLPTDDDLRSLFQDILGIKVKSGINIKTTKFVNTTDIPINYTPLKKIISKEYWDTFYLWEDSEFDKETAYFRGKDYNSFIGTDETYQGMLQKINYEWKGHPKTICVYDPNGKPRKSIRQERIKLKEQHKKKKELEKQKKLQQENEQRTKGVENDLF